MGDNWTIDWEITNTVIKCGETGVINRPLTEGGATRSNSAPTTCHRHSPWKPFRMDLTGAFGIIRVGKAPFLKSFFCEHYMLYINPMTYVW